MTAFRIIITIALSIICFSACKKTKLKGDLAVLIGEWKWDCTIHASSCDNPFVNYDTVASPSINGYDYSLVFIEKGKLELRKNGKKEKKYRIVRRDVRFSDTSYVFLLNNKLKQDFTITYKSKNGQSFLETAYFPSEIVDGFDGCNIKYSVFRKVE